MLSKNNLISLASTTIQNSYILGTRLGKVCFWGLGVVLKRGLVIKAVVTKVDRLHKEVAYVHTVPTPNSQVPVYRLNRSLRDH